MSDVLPILAGLGLGALAGIAYFAALARAARRTIAGAGTAALLRGMALRLVVAAAALTLAAGLGAGAGPLLAAAVGFLLVRLLATRGVRPWS